MQNYTEILESQSLRSSLPRILSNDKTGLTNSSGAAFPLTVVEDGRSCYRTDEHKMYVYSQGVWRLTVDFKKTPIFAQDVAAAYALKTHNHHTEYARKTIDETFTKTLTVRGNMTVVGDIFQGSDRNIKKDITAISNATNILRGIEGVSYVLKASGEQRYGVVAQDVEAVAPHAVVETNDGIKTVHYNGLVGILVAAVNELTEKVDRLEETAFCASK